MSEPILRVDDFSVAYGRMEAVRHVSMCVDQGSVVSIIGANGAGKTSLLNGIMGLLSASGSVVFAGCPFERKSVEARVAAGMSLVPERRELFPNMTVEENLGLGAFRLGRSIRNKALHDVYDRFPRLRERRLQAARTLSGGERQMLAMGRAMMRRPKLLMLDEPSLGLAPRVVREVFQVTVELSKLGVAILLVEQNARAALQISDHAIVMELGEVVMAGSGAALANDSTIVNRYLGF